jgi:hypothetical protein
MMSDPTYSTGAPASTPNSEQRSAGGTTPPINGMPAFIPETAKAQLRQRGYTPEQIYEMKPEEAHRILADVLSPSAQDWTRERPPAASASAMPDSSLGMTKPPPGPDAPKLDWALWAIDRGFNVFLLYPYGQGPKKKDGKEPIHSCYDSTNDPNVATAWWTANPDANIGIAWFKSQHAAIDIDVKDGKPGLDNWRALCEEHGNTPTLTLRTPSGGYHVVFYDPEGYIPNNTELWPGIDARAGGGYCAGPGSTVEGGKPYTVEHDTSIAPIPDWLVQHFGKTQKERQEQRRAAAPISEDEWDRPLSLDYARDHIRDDLLENGPPLMGQGSDGRTYEMCQRMLDYALTDATIVELLKAEWQPAFTLNWYKEKLGNAHHYRQNDIGYDRPKAASERFPSSDEDIAAYRASPAGQAAAEKTKADLARIVAEQKVRREKYPFREPEEDANAKPIEFWDERKTLPRLPGGCNVIAYGQRSSHKSGVMLKYCLDAVFDKGARVLYLAPEGAHGIKTARLPAACKHRGKDIKDLRGRWRTFSVAPGLMNAAEIDELIEACRQNGFRPDIVVIDTLTRAAGAVDISAPLTGIGLTLGMERIAAAFDAAVVAITHPGKEEGRGSIGSSLVESLAFAIWHIGLKKGTEEITLRVEKMKDGEADFSVHFAVERDERRVPIVVAGKATAAFTLPASIQPDEDNRRDLREWVITTLRLRPKGEKWVSTMVLANAMSPREDDEDGDARTRRLKTLCQRLLRNTKTSDRGKRGDLCDLVKRTKDGEMINDGAWFLPDHLRDFGGVSEARAADRQKSL